MKNINIKDIRINNLHWGQRANIKIEDNLTENIEIRQDIRQEDRIVSSVQPFLTYRINLYIRGGIYTEIRENRIEGNIPVTTLLYAFMLY